MEFHCPIGCDDDSVDVYLGGLPTCYPRYAFDCLSVLALTLYALNFCLELLVELLDCMSFSGDADADSVGVSNPLNVSGRGDSIVACLGVSGEDDSLLCYECIDTSHASHVGVWLG